MNSKKQSFIIVCIFIIIAIVMVFTFFRKNENSLDPIKKDIVTDFVKDLKATMWDNYVSQIIEDDFKLISSETKLKDTTGKISSLAQLVDSRFKIVIRYSLADCDVCVDTIMSKVKSLGIGKRMDNVIAITDSRSDRDFLIKLRTKKYPIKVYSLEDNHLGLFMENKGFPFIFVITPEFHVIKIYIPLKETPTKIGDYFVKVNDYTEKLNANVKKQ